MTTVEFESCDVVGGLHSDYIVSRFAKACLHLGAFTAFGFIFLLVESHGTRPVMLSPAYPHDVITMLDVCAQ